MTQRKAMQVRKRDMGRVEMVHDDAHTGFVHLRKDI